MSITTTTQTQQTPSPRPVFAPPPEQRVEYRRIHVDDLIVAPEYQRDLKPARAEKFATNFDLRLLGVIDVAECNGKYYVWDGQHRLETCRIVGWNEPMCCVSFATTPEQAGLFWRGNRERSALKNSTIHRARVIEGDNLALALNQAVRKLGLTIGSSDSANTISAVGTLYNIHARGAGVGHTEEPDEKGILLVSNTLQICKEAWLDQGQYSTKDACKDRILQGIAFFLMAYPEETPERVAEALKNAVPSALVASVQQKGKGAGSNNHVMFAETIVEMYNKTHNRKLHRKHLAGKK